MRTTSKAKSDTSKTSKPLRIALTNIRDLRTNFCDLKTFLFQAFLDVLAISETHLTKMQRMKIFLFQDTYLSKEKTPLTASMDSLFISNPLYQSLTSMNWNFQIIPSCAFLSLLHSTSYLFVFYRSPSNQDCSVLDSQRLAS